LLHFAFMQVNARTEHGVRLELQPRSSKRHFGQSKLPNFRLPVNRSAVCKRRFTVQSWYQ
jgi:hypothetical protein